jgi:hypothetical protein
MKLFSSDGWKSKVLADMVFILFSLVVDLFLPANEDFDWAFVIEVLVRVYKVVLELISLFIYSRL